MSEKLEKQIEELKKRIEELEGKQPKSEPTELPFWMPIRDEESYCYLTSYGDVDYSEFESSYPGDQQRLAIGNYAQSEEILAKRKAKLELLEEIKQWRGKHDPESFRLDWKVVDAAKWEMNFDYLRQQWHCLEVRTQFNPLAIYLSSEELGVELIKHFGGRLDILLEVD